MAFWLQVLGVGGSMVFHRVLLSIVATLLVSWVSLTIKAEGIAGHLAAISAVGMSGGTVTQDGPEIAPNVSGNIMLVYGRSGSTYQACGGRIIEGCIITAKHCLDKFKHMAEVYMGVAPQIYHLPHSYTLEGIDIGKPGDLTSDIAVLKMYLPPGAAVSTSREQLAKKKLELDPKKITQGIAMGYGHSKTEDWFDPKTKQFHKTDTGIGLRRRGFMVIQGYGGPNDESALFGKGVTTQGNILWASAGPSLGAPADSGMVLEHDGLIYGVLSIAAGPTIDALPTFNEPERPEKPYVDEIVSNKFASIADHYDDIIKALDALKCQENTHENLMKNTSATLEKGGAYAKGFDWNAMPEKTKEEVDALVARLANFPPGEKFTLSSPSLTNHGLSFEASGMVKEKERKVPLVIPLPSGQ